jgi:hypothetical protein
MMNHAFSRSLPLGFRRFASTPWGAPSDIHNLSVCVRHQSIGILSRLAKSPKRLHIRLKSPNPGPTDTASDPCMAISHVGSKTLYQPKNTSERPPINQLYHKTTQLIAGTQQRVRPIFEPCFHNLQEDAVSGSVPVLLDNLPKQITPGTPQTCFLTVLTAV